MVPIFQIVSIVYIMTLIQKRPTDLKKKRPMGQGQGIARIILARAVGDGKNKKATIEISLCLRYERDWNRQQ